MEGHGDGRNRAIYIHSMVLFMALCGALSPLEAAGDPFAWAKMVLTEVLHPWSSPQSRRGDLWWCTGGGPTPLHRADLSA